METLKKRIAEHKQEYDDIVKAERQVESFVNAHLSAFDRNSISVAVYRKFAYLYINGLDLDTFEDEYMSSLTASVKAARGDIKWMRLVSESSVTYAAGLTRKNDDGSWFTLHLVIPCAPLEGVCEIIKQPTGKRKQVLKTELVEEDEVIFIVNCGGEHV